MMKFGLSGLGLPPEPPRFPHQLPLPCSGLKCGTQKANDSVKGTGVISSSWACILQCVCPLVTQQVSSRSLQYPSFGPVRIGQGLILSTLTLDSSSCVLRMAPSTSGLPLEFHKICQLLFPGHLKVACEKVLPLSYHQAFILRLRRNRGTSRE